MIGHCDCGALDCPRCYPAWYPGPAAQPEPIIDSEDDGDIEADATEPDRDQPDADFLPIDGPASGHVYQIVTTYTGNTNV